MKNQDYQNPKLQEEELSEGNYDHFFDRHKTWEQIRSERYNCC